LEYNSIPAYKISDHKPVKAFIKLITWITNETLRYFEITYFY
jgi:hypothetical protein